MLIRLLALLCLLSGIASADSDRWYIVEMLGKRAGHMRVVEKVGTGTITTTNTVSFELKRGDVGVVIEMSGEFVETTDGKPLSMKSSQKLGQSEVLSTYTFLEDGVEVSTAQSGNTTVRKQPLPAGPWLTPGAADRYATQRFKSGAKEIVIRSIDPATGLKVVTSTRALGEKVTTKAMGRDLEATKSIVKTSIAPGIKTTEYLDPEGVMVRSETQMGGIPVAMVAASKEEALVAVDQAAPEVFRTTFIKPEHPIKNARTLQRGVYRVSVKEGDLPEFPTTGSQSVTLVPPRAALVTVNASELSPAPPEDAKDPAFLAATTACNIKDERIIELARRAVQSLGEDATPQAKAEACRAYTFTFIKKKNLGVGFATATEVARTREGDCSEHGVFLAAMLRANGIPARVASGLVYADGFAGEEAIFGYHMWAQALIEKDGVHRWVDLDGTLGPQTPYDATHITLALSTLADDDGMESMISIAQALGRLSVKVEEPQP